MSEIRKLQINIWFWDQMCAACSAVGDEEGLFYANAEFEQATNEYCDYKDSIHIL
tara:strand:+ start:627 stop:791 length:165 start_codon:yes stop_codon:yes gene_type:complete